MADLLAYMPYVNEPGCERNETRVINGFCDEVDFQLRERHRLLAEWEALNDDRSQQHQQYTGDSSLGSSSSNGSGREPSGSQATTGLTSMEDLTVLPEWGKGAVTGEFRDF